MFFGILLLLWIIIAGVICFIFGRTPKGRGWAKVFWQNKRARKGLIITFAIIFTIVIIIFILPSAVKTNVNSREVFEDYSKSLLLKMANANLLKIDSMCVLDRVTPELAYIIPQVLKAYEGELKQRKLPRLVKIEDTLRISFDGYKQFKNRSIRITKKVRKSLGIRYSVEMMSYGMNHEIRIIYNDELWDNEQLCGLPVFETSIREGIKPALLMSLMRHISHFELEYQSPKGGHGLFGLDSIDGLNQIQAGAVILKNRLTQTGNLEDAIISFYPERDTPGIEISWKNNPLKRTWVTQVLNDILYYEENGLFFKSQNSSVID